MVLMLLFSYLVTVSPPEYQLHEKTSESSIHYSTSETLPSAWQSRLSTNNYEINEMILSYTNV